MRGEASNEIQHFSTSQHKMKVIFITKSFFFKSFSNLHFCMKKKRYAMLHLLKLRLLFFTLRLFRGAFENFIDIDSKFCHKFYIPHYSGHGNFAFHFVVVEVNMEADVRLMSKLTFNQNSSETKVHILSSEPCNYVVMVIFFIIYICEYVPGPFL